MKVKHTSKKQLVKTVVIWALLDLLSLIIAVVVIINASMFITYAAVLVFATAIGFISAGKITTVKAEYDNTLDNNVRITKMLYYYLQVEYDNWQYNPLLHVLCMHYNNGVLHIITDRPGLIIGKKGAIINKMESLLNRKIPDIKITLHEVSHKFDTTKLQTITKLITAI